MFGSWVGEYFLFGSSGSKKPFGLYWKMDSYDVD
jgi:hypothetical protein